MHSPLIVCLARGLVGAAELGLRLRRSAAFAVAAALAVGLQPAHTRVERGVDRFPYGPPRNPYVMLAAPESRLVGADEVDSLLPDLAKLVVDCVGRGSAPILLGRDPVPAATYGDPSAP